MAIKQISVFLQNEKGSLLEVLDLLSKNDIEIRALSIADTADFGILRIITSSSEETEKILKNGGYICNTTAVVAAFIDDKPGGLKEAVKLLAEKGIDVEYTYAFVTKQSKNACVVLRVKDNESAEKTLISGGIKCLTESEINGI